MSIKAINWAYQRVKVGRHMKSTLLALADIADDDGIAYPGMAKIAAKAEVDRRTVIRHLKRLESLGVIEVTRRQTEGRKYTNVYQLCLEKTIDARHLVEESGSDNLSPPETDTSGNLSLGSSDKVSLGGSDTDVTRVVTDSVTLTTKEPNTNTTTTGDLFSKQHVTVPPNRTQLDDAWQPSDQVFDRLRLRGIPSEFAKGLVDAFRLYWANEYAKPGQWESRFLSHAVHRWEKGGKAQYQAAVAQGISVVDRLQDTSWAPEGMLQ